MDRTNPNGLFFLDSGAHSLYMRHVRKGTGYGFFKTKEFWHYVDAYAGFVKEHLDVIDYYANVDVIFKPDMSWEVLKYLEDKHKLKPVPVVHFGTPLKWLEKHLAAGYEFVGIGGVGQTVTVGDYRKWADQVFSIICPGPTRLPIVRTHGFAMTAYDLMIRYPWWSVDSATWTKVGAFGSIMVPHKRKGAFTFEQQPYIIATSLDSPATKQKGRHYRTLNPGERSIVDEWLDLIEIPMGSLELDKKGNPRLNDKGKPVIKEYGVASHHSQRKIANLLFFERLRAWLPKYPWPLAIKQKQGLGLI